jgi:hypothetical protein
MDSKDEFQGVDNSEEIEPIEQTNNYEVMYNKEKDFYKGIKGELRYQSSVFEL